MSKVKGLKEEIAKGIKCPSCKGDVIRKFIMCCDCEHQVAFGTNKPLCEFFFEDMLGCWFYKCKKCNIELIVKGIKKKKEEKCTKT